MQRLDILVALLFAAIPLVALARRVNVAYPIVLVLGGLVLSFVPGLPHIRLPPDALLLVFLPPLLYWEAIAAPVDEFRTHARVLRTLVIGLVIATSAAVTAVAHALIPGLPWAAAYVLGAVVAPTDAVAFSPVAARLGVPRRTIAIIQGEGLLNDASALVLYVTAVAAVVSGSFSLRSAALTFLVASAGGIAVGALIGLLVTEAARRVKDPDLQTAISILTPFLAYLPAVRLEFSGVLAVVTAGLYLNRLSPVVMTSEARERVEGFAQTVAFLLNTLIFFLVGLQLHAIVDALVTFRPGRLVMLTLIVSATVIAVRFAWLFAVQYVPLLGQRIAADGAEEWKHRVVAAWAGFRGGVSLAAALAIPTTTASGAPFPHRALLIFVTFGVILVTLVGQGLTLPWLVRRLRLTGDEAEAADTRKALAAAATAALRRLEEFERDRQLDPVAVERLRARYENRRDRFAARHPTAAAREALHAYEKLERDLLATQRAELIALRRRGEIDSDILQRVQVLFDLEQVALDRLTAVDAHGEP